MNPPFEFGSQMELLQTAYSLGLVRDLLPPLGPLLASPERALQLAEELAVAYVKRSRIIQGPEQW